MKKAIIEALKHMGMLLYGCVALLLAFPLWLEPIMKTNNPYIIVPVIILFVFSIFVMFVISEMLDK